MKKILIVKTSALGDIVHAFTVVDFLKRVFPDCQIDWVAEKSGAPIVQGNPYVNKVYTIDTKTWRKGKNLKEIKEFIQELRRTHYDFLVDLQGNLKSGLVTGFAYADHKIGFGRSTVPEWPNLFFTTQRFNPPSGKNIREDYLFLVRSFLKDVNIPDTSANVQTPHSNLSIMVCPGSNWSNKTLSKESLQGFLDKIQNHLPETRFHFVWGSPDEKKLVESFHERFPHSVIVDKLSLPALQDLMKSMKLVIAMDSLPLHLAGTTPALTYSVFGPSSAAKYNPLGERHHALQGNCPYGKTFEKRCPILRTCPTGACIKDLTPDMIWNDFWKWYQKYL